MGWQAGGVGGDAVAAACAPLLLLCWLCCWPDDTNSDSSSGKHQQKPIISVDGRRRSSDMFGRRRFGSSAVSLHLPSTSGSGQTKQPLSAHRSHEEIRSRRKSHHDTDPETRYHSAPSVIDEVIHRRDWERSTKELYIPLKPEEVSNASSPERACEAKSDEQIVGRPCKKHYTNIKSSKKKDVEDKDVDENDVSNFYIGDTNCTLIKNATATNAINIPEQRKNRGKEEKQSLNESIKRERPRMGLVPLAEYQMSGLEWDASGAELDRSGAMHHSVESRSSLYRQNVPIPPPSVEAVGYESDASYLEEGETQASAWRRAAVASGVAASVASAATWARARHASAGDVLAPTLRPQSGALSESELDWELEGCDEPPPSYHELQLDTLQAPDRKETAI